MNLQICDPARPTTIVSGGSQRRRRWEFMQLPTDPAGWLSQESTAWSLLQKFDVNKENAKLEKSAIYKFQAKWGAEWGRNRVWLAGDAAHLMPPFAGQGLCSGLRDAKNLSFKILHLLDNPSIDPSKLLSTYGTERSVHVQHAIHMSVEMGKIICIPDPVAAEARDKAMGGKNGDPRLVMPPPKPEVLGSGLLASEGGEAALVSGVGRYVTNGRLKGVDGEGRMDDVVGRGWVIVAVDGAEPKLAPRHAQLWNKLGGKVASLLPKGSEPVAGKLVDVRGTYHGTLVFLRKGARYCVVRPDYYSFGLAANDDELGVVLQKLGNFVYPGESWKL
jgi:flavoprotein hydroxylase